MEEYRKRKNIHTNQVPLDRDNVNNNMHLRLSFFLESEFFFSIHFDDDDDEN